MITNHSCLDDVSVWDEEGAELGAKDAQATIKAHILVLQETQAVMWNEGHFHKEDEDPTIGGRSTGNVPRPVARMIRMFSEFRSIRRRILKSVSQDCTPTRAIWNCLSGERYKESGRAMWAVPTGWVRLLTSLLVHLENSPGMDDKPNSLEFFLWDHRALEEKGISAWGFDSTKEKWTQLLNLPSQAPLVNFLDLYLFSVSLMEGKCLQAKDHWKQKVYHVFYSDE